MRNETQKAGYPQPEPALQNKSETMTFIRQRSNHFSMSLLVMLICFPLYYLGLFGGVEGPLQPAQIGQWLAGIGVSRSHILFMFAAVMILAVTWNWVFNLFGPVIGYRLICSRMGGHGLLCGAPVTRQKIADPKTDRVTSQYGCAHGHKHPAAHFHPLKKGAFSHTAWIISLAGCLTVLCLS
jgi:hypothetical protein